MLVLTRKIGEKIIIGDKVIEVKVISVDGGSVQLGITAPADVSIHREEIFNKILNHESRKAEARGISGDIDITD